MLISYSKGTGCVCLECTTVELHKDAFYATDGDGYINRDGSSFFVSSLCPCVWPWLIKATLFSPNVVLALKAVAVHLQDHYTDFKLLSFLHFKECNFVCVIPLQIRQQQLNKQ